MILHFLCQIPFRRRNSPSLYVPERAQVWFGGVFLDSPTHTNIPWSTAIASQLKSTIKNKRLSSFHVTGPVEYNEEDASVDDADHYVHNGPDHTIKRPVQGKTVVICAVSPICNIAKVCHLTHIWQLQCILNGEDCKFNNVPL